MYKSIHIVVFLGNDIHEVSNMRILSDLLDSGYEILRADVIESGIVYILTKRVKVNE